MGIYFRDILLIRISRGANNCGQHSLAKNIYFIMRFSPHSQLFYFNDRLEFCEFIEWKIKRINNADLFSQLPLLIFIKGANISGGHCIYIYIYIYIYTHNFVGKLPPTCLECQCINVLVHFNCAYKFIEQIGKWLYTTLILAQMSWVKQHTLLFMSPPTTQPQALLFSILETTKTSP